MEPQAEDPRSTRIVAYGVIALLYLSFILHIANSQAVVDFISEVTRLLQKFVF